ncbi:hypothetical protein MIMGU_mgv11b019964mg, partial [Erythranthe guttata]
GFCSSDSNFVGQFQICKLRRKRGFKTVFIRGGSGGSVNSNCRGPILLLLPYRPFLPRQHLMASSAFAPTSSFLSGKNIFRFRNFSLVVARREKCTNRELRMLRFRLLVESITSSGKTYTMIGITEYALPDIYGYIQKHQERDFVFKFSAMEIYNELVRDLLSVDNTPLRLLDDTERETTVEKLTEEILRDWSHVIHLLCICEGFLLLRELHSFFSGDIYFLHLILFGRVISETEMSSATFVDGATPKISFARPTTSFALRLLYIFFCVTTYFGSFRFSYMFFFENYIHFCW